MGSERRREKEGERRKPRRSRSSSKKRRDEGHKDSSTSAASSKPLAAGKSKSTAGKRKWIPLDLWGPRARVEPQLETQTQPDALSPSDSTDSPEYSDDEIEQRYGGHLEREFEPRGKRRKFKESLKLGEAETAYLFKRFGELDDAEKTERSDKKSKSDDDGLSEEDLEFAAKKRAQSLRKRREKDKEREEKLLHQLGRRRRFSESARKRAESLFKNIEKRQMQIEKTEGGAEEEEEGAEEKESEEVAKEPKSDDTQALLQLEAKDPEGAVERQAQYLLKNLEEAKERTMIRDERKILDELGKSKGFHKKARKRAQFLFRDREKQKMQVEKAKGRSKTGRGKMDKKTKLDGAQAVKQEEKVPKDAIKKQAKYSLKNSKKAKQSNSEFGDKFSRHFEKDKYFHEQTTKLAPLSSEEEEPKSDDTQTLLQLEEKDPEGAVERQAQHLLKKLKEAKENENVHDEAKLLHHLGKSRGFRKKSRKRAQFLLKDLKRQEKERDRSGPKRQALLEQRSSRKTSKRLFRQAQLRDMRKKKRRFHETPRRDFLNEPSYSETSDSEPKDSEPSDREPSDA